MSLNNASALLASRQRFPVTEGLWFLGDAEDSRNTTGSGFITQMFDQSGNGRHATGNETLETTGMNGHPNIVTTSTRLKVDGGAETFPASDKFSYFWVAKSSDRLQGINADSSGNSGISSVWTVNANTPLMFNDAGANVAVGATDFDAFALYRDNTPRTFAWVYEDAGNIRRFYADGALAIDSNNGAGGWVAGTAAGKFVFSRIGLLAGEGSNRIALLAIFEAKLLTTREVLDLHSYVKRVLEFVA